VAIRELQAGSPAARAGLAAGDVIVSIGEEVVTGVDDVARILDAGKIGLNTRLRVLRRGAIRDVALTPEDRAQFLAVSTNINSVVMHYSLMVPINNLR